MLQIKGDEFGLVSRDVRRRARPADGVGLGPQQVEAPTDPGADVRVDLGAVDRAVSCLAP
jgi:hypothetical protein